EDVQAFFRTYYAPNNATLTAVGDFEEERARGLVAEYFGEIPSGPEVPDFECAEPFVHLPVRETFRDTNANLPAVFLSYGMPNSRDDDVPALRLLARILGGAESSRLHQPLVREDQAAVEILYFP